MIALVATVNCSATVIRRAAEEIRLSGLLAEYPNVDGVVAFAHGNRLRHWPRTGRGGKTCSAVLWGHATHPNVGAARCSSASGCEGECRVARMKAMFGDDGQARFPRA